MSAQVDNSSSGALVLLVDDSPTQAQRWARTLQAAGFRVCLAVNGREALGQARRWHPDVIVSDVLMPVMDGFALCRELRRDSELTQVPLILHTTTYLDSRDEEFALGLGAARFVLKPSQPEELLAEIRAVLAAGHVATPSPIAVDDQVFLQGYSERLAAKLLEKVAELELEIAERTHAQEVNRQSEIQIQALNADLERRVVERTAQLESAVMELDAFSYSVSHDLRAPLRAVNGFSSILMDDHASELTPTAMAHLQAIVDGARHMGELIDDLLALSRLGRQPLRKRRVLPAEVVKRALAELAPDQEGRSITWLIEELPACEADAALLMQVYVNLLANALKFTRRHAEAHIEIGSRQTDGQVEYFVKDDGAGFDMRYADKLFGVFQRLHRAEDFEGTGVGLAIVQRIVNRHGGRVWAEASPEHGATFFFTLAGPSRHAASRTLPPGATSL